MVEIKATDLLAKLVTDVAQIKDMVKLQGYQYTLILRKLNEIGTVKVEKPQAIQSSGSSISAFEPIKNTSFTSKPKQIQADKVTETIVQTNKPIEQNYNFDEAPEFKTTTNAEQEPPSREKVPITQLVYTSTGKPVAIAVVEIKNVRGESVQKLKTNSVGRWSALVEPGKYIAHLTRRYDNETIDYEQVIEVAAGTKQVEILPPEAYRRKTTKQKM